MTDAPLPLRTLLVRLAPGIYGPLLLFSLGEGALIPVIPAFATALGADLPGAALVASALVIGELSGNLPAGWLVSRIGERWTMLISTVVAALGMGAALLATSLTVLTAGFFVIGVSAATFSLARHSFMTTYVPYGFRARALVLVGGALRLGALLGSFLAAALLTWFVSPSSVLWFGLICLAAVVALLLATKDPEDELRRNMERSQNPPPAQPGERAGVLETMWRYRGTLLTVGLASSSLSLLRSARQVLLPLWGTSLGLEPHSVALIVGISGAIDFTLFYASGQVMDRFGRLWAALPATVLMGVSFLLLAVTHDAPWATGWFVVAAVLQGLGNGTSSGLLMTIGSDTAPRHDPAPFLGAWRTMNSGGGALAPLLIAAVSSVLSLAWAAGVLALVAAFSFVGFTGWVPRRHPRP